MVEFFMRWIPNATTARITVFVIVILVIFGLVRLLQRVLFHRIRDTDARYRMRRFVGLVGYLGLIIAIVAIFSRQLGGFLVALGLAGAGVAFALQEVIASVAGWFAIAFGRFYKTGDRIQLAGIRGDVIDVGILRTTLMECGEWVNGDLYNGRIVRISNSSVFKGPVFNYSADFPFLWDEVSIPILYGSDYQWVRNLLHQIAEEVVGEYSAHAKTVWKRMVAKYSIEEAKVEPMVSMEANDNWVEFTLRYVVDYRERRSKKDRLFARILEELEKRGEHVAGTATTVRLAETSVITLRKPSESNTASEDHPS